MLKGISHTGMECDTELHGLQLLYDIQSKKSYLDMVYDTRNKTRKAAVKNVTLKHKVSNDHQIKNS